MPPCLASTHISPTLLRELLELSERELEKLTRNGQLKQSSIVDCISHGIVLGSNFYDVFEFVLAKNMATSSIESTIVECAVEAVAKILEVDPNSSLEASAVLEETVLALQDKGVLNIAARNMSSCVLGCAQEAGGVYRSLCGKLYPNYNLEHSLFDATPSPAFRTLKQRTYEAETGRRLLQRCDNDGPNPKGFQLAVQAAEVEYPKLCL